MKVIAAPLAGISPLRLNPVPVGLALASRADVTLSKASLKEMLKARFIGRELFEEVSDGQAGFLFHGSNRSTIPTVCQGYNPLT